MFLVFVAFSLLCFAAGYTARRRGWAPERWSRPMHLHTIVWLWSPVTLLAFWGLGTGAATDVVTLMLAQPVLMVGPAAVMAMTVALLGFRREQRGVMTLAAALSNHGFTLGSYLCYALLSPSDDALRYGIAYVTSMQVFMVLIFYPVAAHYAPGGGRGLGRLMIESFITVRAAPLYMAVVGLTLKLLHVEYPAAAIARWHVMDVLFFAGAAGANLGIGLRFRFGDTWHTLHLHGLLAVVQFLVHPLMAGGAIAGMTMAGYAPSELVRNVMLIEACIPTALNTVIVSNLFHLDARLAASLWLWNTLGFCVVMLPIVLWIW
jgi:hypothetical protein